MVAIFPKRDPPLCFAHRHGQAQWATTLQQSNIEMENHQYMVDWPIKKTSIYSGLVDLQVGHDKNNQRICHLTFANDVLIWEKEIVHCQVWNILENTSSSIPLFCSIYPHVWWDVCWFYHHMSLHRLCCLNTLICLRKQHVFVGKPQILLFSLQMLVFRSQFFCC